MLLTAIAEGKVVNILCHAQVNENKSTKEFNHGFFVYKKDNVYVPHN